MPIRKKVGPKERRPSCVISHAIGTRDSCARSNILKSWTDVGTYIFEADPRSQRRLPEGSRAFAAWPDQPSVSGWEPGAETLLPLANVRTGLKLGRLLLKLLRKPSGLPWR